MNGKLEFIGQANFTWMEIVSLLKYCKLCFKIHYVKDFFRYFLSLFLSRKKKARKWPKKAKRKTVGGFERLAFKGWNEVQCKHFYKNARPRFAFSGFFIRFSLTKLKTHLREHSRQSPVPKIRSCFLSEFSGNGRTCFFFFLWFAFFLLFQKKEERNERKNFT